jgi:hypothetical protein
MKFGSTYQSIKSVSAAYTVVDGDDVIRVDASAGAVPIILPDPAGRCQAAGDCGRVCVVKTDSSSYPVTVATASGSIVGVSVLRNQNQSADYQSDGSATWYAFGAQPSVFMAEVAITNAELKAIRATPKTLVQAPGAGLAVKLVGGVLLLDYGTNVLTESADNLAVKYTNGSGAAVSETIEATGFIDASADTLTSIEPIKDAIVAKSGSEDKALVLHNTGDGEYGGNAGADTVLRAKIFYTVVSTGW